jgi:hypothetical protein
LLTGCMWVGPWPYRHHYVPTYRPHVCGPMALQTSRRTDIQATFVWAHGPIDITTYRHTGRMFVGPWPYRYHNVQTYRPHLSVGPWP